PICRAAANSGVGRGIDASRPPFTTTLSLPPEMAAFQPNEIVLQLESSEIWPNAGVITEIYNWEAQRWDTIDYDGPGDLSLPDAAPYMRAGTLQLRLDGRIREADCLYIDARMTGVLPGTVLPRCPCCLKSFAPSCVEAAPPYC
ncbi:hypothetical protein HC891_11330, partial [Candidatus Gracilibacteria bacterium]|nr:hypothetical protein [Candidatus Gracilibacteria bacterium]